MIKIDLGSGFGCLVVSSLLSFMSTSLRPRGYSRAMNNYSETKNTLFHAVAGVGRMLGEVNDVFKAWLTLVHGNGPGFYLIQKQCCQNDHKYIVLQSCGVDLSTRAFLIILCQAYLIYTFRNGIKRDFRQKVLRDI